MIVKENEPLAKYSLMKIGGRARQFFIPQSTDELTQLLSEFSGKGEDYYLISGGSNILISDQHDFDHVVYLGKFDTQISDLGGGRFYAGASVRLQSFILKINELGYGGIEYLFSVPGMIGGAVRMNAGRGESYHQTLGDYVESVYVWHEGRKMKVAKSECAFAHRSSLFQSDGYVILGASFCFPAQDPAQSEMNRKERLAHCKKAQDTSAPNLGTLLKKSNKGALWLLKRFRVGYPGGIHFSGKTSNWIVNDGQGTFAQAMEVIGKSDRIHRLFGCRQELEIVVWK